MHVISALLHHEHVSLRLPLRPMNSLSFDRSYATLDEIAASAAFMLDDSDSSVADGVSSPPPSSFAPRQLFAPFKAAQDEQEKRARRRAQVASSSRRQRSRRKVCRGNDVGKCGLVSSFSVSLLNDRRWSRYG